MSDCPFCRIVDGAAPASRLLETERTLGFLDTSPATPGHALVVPKPHRETLPDLDRELTADLFDAVRRLTAAVDAVLEPEGVTVVQSNGSAAGQDVSHAHVHVIPRTAGDGVTIDWAGDASLADETTVAEIREAVADR